MVVNQLLKYGEFGIVLFDNFQVTERTRNRVTGKTVRGFESHRLRQKQERQALCLVFLFFTKMYDEEPLRVARATRKDLRSYRLAQR